MNQTYKEMSKLAYIQRYLFIIRFVRKNLYCTSEEILQHLEEQFQLHDILNVGISLRTLSRDISDIRSFLGIDIEYSNSNRGYYISEDTDYQSNIEQILETFDILNSIGGDNGTPPYILPEKRRSRGTEYFLTLKKAIQEKKMVTFNYKKFFPDEAVIRTIEPYALKESRGRWYLLGFEEKSNPPVAKSFGLDRISSLQILPRKIQHIKEVDWAEKYKHCFAMFTDGEPEHVVLSVDHRDGNYIEAMPIHPSQQITITENGAIVKLYISVTLDLIMELMSRSWSLEVIEPLSLRERIRKIHEEALLRNQ